MKNYLFCVGVEIKSTLKNPAGEELQSAYVNVYVGANDVYEALERINATLKQDGYDDYFIRGSWVVDSDCNDGFCPVDELTPATRGDLLFNNQVQYGQFSEWSTDSDYEY